MGILALFVIAALAFSILAGVIESRGAREARRRLLARSSIMLHPLARHPLPRIRYSRSRRALHHGGLFIGFLLATYLGMLVLKAVHAILARWF